MPYANFYNEMKSWMHPLFLSITETLQSTTFYDQPCSIMSTLKECSNLGMKSRRE